MYRLRQILPVLALVFGCVAPAIAMEDAPIEAVEEVETVDINLTVKGTQDVLADSKKQAINEGEKGAFYKALMKLAPKQARDIYRKLRGEDITRYVVSFTIEREVEKAGYYEADITYRFNKPMLEQVIGVDKGIADADGIPTGNGLLIIPPYDTGEADIWLFERENLWRAILNNVALEVGQGLLVMPFGDPRDVTLLSDNVILSGDEETLAQLARRYGTRNVVIAFARSREVDDKPLVEVVLRKAGGKKSEEMVLQYPGRLAEDTLDLLLARAAREVSLKLRESIDDFSVFGVSEADKVKPLVVRAEYGYGRDWRKILETMETLPGLESIEVGAVATHYAQVTLLHRGSQAMVNKAMLARGLNVDTSNTYWVVRLP